MVTPTSRRAFLTGRRAPTSPWVQFCERLARTCLGAVRVEPAAPHDSGRGQAWLKPLRFADVRQARALCAEYGVSLVATGCARTADELRPTLWVLPLSEGAAFESLDSQNTQWRVDAGCLLSHLQSTGLFSEADCDANLTVGQWFASLTAAHQLDDRAVGSQVLCAEVLFADGTVEVLGAFGATAQTPLLSLSVQRLVPKLFELSGSTDAQRCAACEPWPAQYRLDALMAEASREPNLAQLFLGHRGQLGWVQTVWLRRVVQPTLLASELVREKKQAKVSPQDEPDLLPVSQFATRLDHALKRLLDPQQVFGSNFPLNGLESAP